MRLFLLSTPANIRTASKGNARTTTGKLHNHQNNGLTLTSLILWPSLRSQEASLYSKFEDWTQWKLKKDSGGPTNKASKSGSSTANRANSKANSDFTIVPPSVNRSCLTCCEIHCVEPKSSRRVSKGFALVGWRALRQNDHREAEGIDSFPTSAAASSKRLRNTSKYSKRVKIKS